MPSARLIALAVACAVSLPGGASAVPAPLLLSDNLDVVATIPDPGAVGGRIVGEHLYTTSAAGLRIYDLDTADGVPVLSGALPLPTYQNEDIDTDGRLALLSSDYLVAGMGPLTVVDVSDPRLPVRLATILVPAAHTASCVLSCRFAWTGGDRDIYVVDLRTPSAPRVIGSFRMPATVHDVDVDADGIAWVSTTRGLFAYSPSEAAPLSPTQVASLPDGAPGSFENDSLLHNSLVRGETIYVVEEDYFPLANGLCADDGAFQTGRITVREDGSRTVERLDRYSVGTDASGNDRLPFGAVSCSAHYFGVREDGVAAVAWYEQGIRVLDTSDPADIREIGYALTPGETISVTIRGEFLYAFDTVLGLVVLRLSGGPGQPAVSGPLRARSPLAAPDPAWGYACRVYLG